MPQTRQNQRRSLSVLLSANDSPSPRATRQSSIQRKRAKNQDNTAKITPARRKKKKLSKSSKSTPVFDPELHCTSDDQSHDSDETAFVNSIHFTPAKSNVDNDKAQADEEAQVHRDYEVVVDYSSDSDGFTFSPVKFIPTAPAPNLDQKIQHTLTPRTKTVSRMVWNSEKKKVEEYFVRLQSTAEISQKQSRSRRIPTPRESLSHGHPESDLSDNACTSSEDSIDGESQDIVEVQERHSSIQPEILSATSEADISKIRKAGLHTEQQHEVEDDDNRIQAPSTSHRQHNSAMGQNITGLRQDKASGPRISSYQSAPLRDMPAGDTSNVTTRSPRVHLTRAVSGSVNMQTLEKLAIPDYFFTKSLSKPSPIRPRQYARIPKKLPSTIPEPFQLSQARPRTRMYDKDEQTSGVYVETDQDSNRSSRVRHFESSSNSTSTASYNKLKRKAHEVSTGRHILSSPVKRIKMSETERRVIAPLPERKRFIKRVSPMYTAKHRLEKTPTQDAKRDDAMLQSQERNRILCERRNMQAGLVPRTLYSPEKQHQMTKTSSATKPKPFKFSTEARAARSPSLPRSETLDKQITNRGVPRLHVPVLQTAPFIPKPSNRPTTVASSPARKLPSRLQIRREFDRIAEAHAEEVVERKRREIELLAAERERRMAERQGWQDSGRAAVEQWAARAKLNSAGKQDWID